MKFADTPLDCTVGAVLAHATTLGDQRLKKGHVLSAQDIALAKALGIASLVVAILDEHDVGEDDAARRIAAPLANEAIATSAPFTGRVNLISEVSGLFFADADEIDALNRVDPAITIATLATGTFVRPGDMVATVKIIPFAAAQGDVAEAVELASADLMQIQPAQPKRVRLIATTLPSLKTSVMDKTRRLLDARLDHLGSICIDETRIPHTRAAVSEALSSGNEDADLVVVFGASAIADMADVIPAGLLDAGGTVERLGMPVDPGNLLLLGRLGDKPVIGAPGCARSPAENGFDWVLQRLVCDLPITSKQISGLGVGGLLKEISTRPQPRAGNQS